MTVEKLQGALTGWITLSDNEVEEEFKRRNEKVKLAVVAFPADKFRARSRRRPMRRCAKYFEEHKND